MFLIRFIVTGAVFIAAMFAGTSTADASFVNRSGWYIRFCPSQTEATSIKLRVGLAGDSNAPSRQDWTALIMGGEVIEASLPKDFNHASGIWIYGEVEPHDKNVDMCILYHGRVIKEMIFKGEEEHEITINGSGDCNC